MSHKKYFGPLITLAAILFVFISYSASFAEPQPPGIDDHLAALKERLKLSDGQAAQIRGILEENRKIGDANREKNKADRGKSKADREQVMKEAQKRQQAADEKIKAVLNDEQKSEYDKIKKEQRQQMRQKHGGEGRGGPGKGRGQSPR